MTSFISTRTPRQSLESSVTNPSCDYNKFSFFQVRIVREDDIIETRIKTTHTHMHTT